MKKLFVLAIAAGLLGALAQQLYCHCWYSGYYLHS